ncbi:MAG: fibrobacter succinogenes major paralogous domain-containing protein [Bacteroidales bacterium]|nr:fibrobacter succinogenes major paralogous domain-containing protein [Bacteroidales bacterium]
MKKTILFALITMVVNSVLFAQVPPQKMGYQMVVRNANNELVANQQIGVRLSIIKSSPNGNPVFVETHSATTNANALLTVQVGTGTPTPGSDLANIDWGGDDYYIQCDIDPLGGNNYTITGNQQLITVPYAFFSGKSVYADTSDYNNLLNRPTGNTTGDILYWNSSDSSWHILPIGQQGQVLTVHNGGLTWTNNNNMLNNVPPTVVTDSVFDITGRTTLVMCHITNAGSTGVIASGVCWSINPYPSLGNSYTTDGTSIDTFISKATGLVSGTTYYVRAYATNAAGTSYGNPIKFTTPVHCGTVTDYDGNTYQTIYIGAQCWMKENLKTTHYSNGAAITKTVPTTCTSTYPYANNKFYYIYNNDTSYIATRGLLYSWGAVMNGAGSSSNNPSGIQGICPSGWHVPSNAEWCELENFVEPGIDVNCNSTGYRGSMAKRLAGTQYWTAYQSNSFAPGYCNYDITGFNSSGFTAIPGGCLQSYQSYYANCGNSSSTNSTSFTGLNTDAYFWSCTVNGSGSYNPVYFRSLNYSYSGIQLNTKSTTFGDYQYYFAMSVRCIKN